MDYKGKKILVVGMKSSGVSVATLLKKNRAYVSCYDDKITELLGFDFVNIDNESDIKKFDLIVVSPSIPNEHKIICYALKQNIPIKGELEIGCGFLNCPQIMITGTNGKTTVTTMIEKLLAIGGFKAKAMGNIGYPVSQVVLDGTELDYAVIEVSSFQLEYSKVDPYISAVINIAPDHMDRYEKYNDYISAKKRICLYQTEKEYLFFNAEDGIAKKFSEKSKAIPKPVGLTERYSDIYIKNNYFFINEKPLCPIKNLHIKGEHNKFNMLMALNIGYLLGVTYDAMCNLVKTYTLLPNRIEYVTTLNGKKYYNDSKGTNIHACRYAIKSLEGSIGLIVGGSDKKEDFCELFEGLDERVKFIAITGANAQKIYGSAMKMGFVNVEIFNTLPEAVKFLTEETDIDNVLLSPCCASFDRYKNYAERGEKFKESIYAIKNKKN